jgi:hypothetical protein
MIASVGVRVSLLAAALLCCSPLMAQTEEMQTGPLSDGGVSYFGRGQEVLESIYVPDLPGAPFSLTLATEWTRPMLTGGTYTAVNARPIKRDSKGRLYMERWMLVPKGNLNASRMSWIQIEDPVAGLYYECNARTHVCDEKTYQPDPTQPSPTQVKSGPLQGGRGFRLHEDLGAETVAGLPVRAYRDTTTINPGVMGNDREMTYRREMRYSSQLGFNLVSILQNPALGEQRFTVTEITTSEPEAKWFQPPEGWRVVDRRKSADSAP